jgi:hypothetical protein
MKDKHLKADGLSGDLINLVVMEHWTANAADYLDKKIRGTSPPSKQMTWNSKMLVRSPIHLTGRKISTFFFVYGGLRHIKFLSSGSR